MKKGFFVFGFTFCLLFGCINTALAESDYLFWDFSETADKYNGLNLKQNNGTAEIDSGELVISYNIGKAPESHFLIDKEYGAITDSAVIEFDYKSDAESVNLYLQNSPNGGSVFRLKQMNNTTLRATYEASEGANSNVNTNIKTDFVRGQWYNIKFILNFADEKCSVVIDNEIVLDNVCLFYNSGGLTDAFYDVLIGPDKAGSVYIDNFAVYETNSTAAFLNVRSELLDIPETAEESIELPLELRDDITVSWESSDETVISKNGEVTFPSMSEGDKIIELYATLSKDGESIVRTYTVNVPARLSDGEAIELAVAEVSIDEKIYDEYLLPVSAENDVIIDWTVDKTELADISAVSINGFYKVTTQRQPTDEVITFTAEFSRGEESVTKTYQTTLARIMTDKMSVEEDAASIIVPASVKEGFVLPLAGTNTTVISWTSKNEEYITISENTASVVYRDTIDKDIVLVAKVTKGSESVEKEFIISVEKDVEANKLLLEEAKDALDLGNVSKLTSDITLPLSGLNGTVISWVSSNTKVITNTGIITRGSSSKSANLIATITKGTLSDQKVFRVTVSGKSSGGGGGGGGGGNRTGSSANPAVSVTLPAEKIPVKENAPLEVKPLFADVDKNHWAFEYVEELGKKGIVGGDENGSFNPENPVKREEFVKMLIEAFEGEAEFKEKVGFSDVSEDSWYAKYVYAAFEKGYIAGISENMFGAGEVILREQIAAILYRVLGAAVGGDAEFEDSDSISEYAKKAVGAISASGIISGDTNGNFRPQSPATRAETAKMICEAVKILKED